MAGNKNASLPVRGGEDGLNRLPMGKRPEAGDEVTHVYVGPAGWTTRTSRITDERTLERPVVENFARRHDAFNAEQLKAFIDRLEAKGIHQAKERDA